MEKGKNMMAIATVAENDNRVAITDTARHDHALCLIPGLFKTQFRGKKNRTNLNITYHYNDKCIIHIRNYQPLNATDLLVLQGLVALIGKTGSVHDNNNSNNENDVISGLFGKLKVEEKEIGHATVLIARLTIYRLCREIGLTLSKQNYKTIRTSLQNLSGVTIIIEDTHSTATASYHLLSYSVDNKDRLTVILNPRLTAGILGIANHTAIDMHEVRTLHRDITRILHQRLCAIVPVGQSRQIKLDTLVQYIYYNDDDDALSSSTKSWRRKKTKLALDQLELKLNWNIREYVKCQYQIKRPQRRKLS